MKELMPCPAVHEDLLSIEVHLDRFPGLHGEKTCRKFHVVRGSFGAESPADIRFYDADFSNGQAERHGHGALEIMRHLRRGIKGQISKVIVVCDTSLGFDKGAVLAFVYKRCCLYQVAFLECRSYIAEFLVHFGADIPGIFVMDLRGAIGHCLLDGKEHGKLLVVHPDEGQGVLGGLEVNCRNGSHIVAHMTDPVGAENSLVIASGTYAIPGQTRFF